MFDETTLIIAKGSFVEECRNRFLCKVDVPELGHTLCYVPSSARLTNLIALERRIVCLSPLAKSNRLKYSLLAREDGRRYTLLNLNLVNSLMHAALKSERRYQKVDLHINRLASFGYRSDLLACFKQVEYFEIKSLLSDNATVSFPSILGERALRQLEQISEGLVNGEHFTYILALLNPIIRTVALDETNFEYNSLIKKCFTQGMKIRIYRFNWELGGQPSFTRARKTEKSFILSLQEVFT